VAMTSEKVKSQENPDGLACEIDNFGKVWCCGVAATHDY
jgi:hypothetical protein